MATLHTSRMFMHFQTKTISANWMNDNELSSLSSLGSVSRGASEAFQSCFDPKYQPWQTKTPQIASVAPVPVSLSGTAGRPVGGAGGS